MWNKNMLSIRMLSGVSQLCLGGGFSELYRWTFSSLPEALAKRDAIFGLVATE